MHGPRHPRPAGASRGRAAPVRSRRVQPPVPARARAARAARLRRADGLRGRPGGRTLSRGGVRHRLLLNHWHEARVRRPASDAAAAGRRRGCEERGLGLSLGPEDRGDRDPRPHARRRPRFCRQGDRGFAGDSVYVRLRPGERAAPCSIDDRAAYVESLERLRARLRAARAVDATAGRDGRGRDSTAPTRVAASRAGAGAAPRASLGRGRRHGASGARARGRARAAGRLLAAPTAPALARGPTSSRSAPSTPRPSAARRPRPLVTGRRHPRGAARPRGRSRPCASRRARGAEAVRLLLEPVRRPRAVATGRAPHGARRADPVPRRKEQLDELHPGAARSWRASPPAAS